MKRFISYFTVAALLACIAACHENPHNTFGGPSNQPKDTATAKHDTTSVGTRTDH